MAPVSMTLSDF